MSEMSPEEIVPTLQVAIEVTEEVPEYHDVDCPIGWKVPDAVCSGSACNEPVPSEVVIETAVDEDITLVLVFPNGEPVDRERIEMLVTLSLQSYPQILDQMEAPSDQ
jgi:hypothetical protein